MDLEKLMDETQQWVLRNMDVLSMPDNTIEVATFQIDSFGDTIYCFVEEKDGYYRVSDDGRMLFKLDPGQTNQELYETAAEIAVGSGYYFDEDVCEIYAEVEEDDVANSVMRLAQLQLAISYLG